MKAGQWVDLFVVSVEFIKNESPYGAKWKVFRIKLYSFQHVVISSFHAILSLEMVWLSVPVLRGVFSLDPVEI
jgi:hypothetical protein